MDPMSSNLEDYLEVIFSLESQHSEARATSSVGVMVPSEKFEWVCRSIDISEKKKEERLRLLQNPFPR